MYGVFSSKSIRTFHYNVAMRMNSMQRLALYCLKLDNKTVGVLYGFEYHSRFYYYNSGFDPSYRECSLGLITLKRVIEECICRNLTEFDFLRGQSPYKLKYKPLVQRNTFYLQVRQQKRSVMLAFHLQAVNSWIRTRVRRLLPTAAVASMASTVNKWRSLGRRYE